MGQGGPDEVLIAIGEALPLALGVAMSPVPIAAALLMLPVGDRQNRVPALLSGWALGVVGVALVVTLTPGLETAGGDPTRASGYLRIVCGVGLLALGIWHWFHRKTPRSAAPLLDRLRGLGFGRTLAMGVALVALNPMNLALIAAAANFIDTEQLGHAEQFLVLLAFTVVASSTIAAPLLIHAVMRDRVTGALDRCREWLLRHNEAILAVLLLLFGAALIAYGVEAALL